MYEIIKSLFIAIFTFLPFGLLLFAIYQIGRYFKRKADKM